MAVHANFFIPKESAENENNMCRDESVVITDELSTVGIRVAGFAFQSTVARAEHKPGYEIDSLLDAVGIEPAT